MKIAIMQPYFFPYIGYWQLINSVDKFIILDDVNFIKKGWIHKNNILLHGQAHTIHISIQKASQNKLIRDLTLSSEDDWRSKLISTLRHAYKKAPYFEPVFTMLESIISYPEVNISKYLHHSIVALCEYMGITTTIVPSSTQYDKGSLSGQERIIDICKKENASVYINPIGGTTLYEPQLFEAVNIELSFIQTGLVAYKQFNGDFVPNLSIVDVLMFNSKSEIAELLTLHQFLNGKKV